MNLPDPGKSKRAAFARAAQETFLSHWVHGGLLSAADAVLFVSRDAADKTGGGRRRGSDDAWRAVAAELVSGVEDRVFPGRLVEKAATVGRLLGNKSRKAGSSEKQRPWDTWSSSSGASDADTADAEPPLAGASALLRGLLRAGRSEEALLAGCRLASSSGGASVAWKCIVECAADSWGAVAGAATYIDAVASIYSAFAGGGGGGPPSRRRTAASRRSADVFESAFAGAVAALSGDLPVRKGWRSQAASAANALAPGSPFMVALNTVPRTLKADSSKELDKNKNSGKAKNLTVVVTSAKKSQQPPAQGASQAHPSPCVRVVMF